MCVTGRTRLHDPLGTTYKPFRGGKLPGVVIPLSTPFVFDSRKALHAGHVAHADRAARRVVLVAFTTLNLTQLNAVPCSILCGLGFPLPRPSDPHSKGSMNNFDAPLRERQLSIHEALNLPASTSRSHDVIEVLDSQDQVLAAAYLLLLPPNPSLLHVELSQLCVQHTNRLPLIPPVRSFPLRCCLSFPCWPLASPCLPVLSLLFYFGIPNLVVSCSRSHGCNRWLLLHFQGRLHWWMLLQPAGYSWNTGCLLTGGC